MSAKLKSDHNWLDEWASHLRGKRVLELGCGQGADTSLISGWAESLIACDLKPHSAPQNKAKIIELDHSKSLPFISGEFDVVVASLCLHYFLWADTENIIKNISRVLAKEGILICRLNSDQDFNYGAVGHPEIEPGLYDVNGASKRFFSQSDIHSLFGGRWRLRVLQHKTIDRYEKPKSVWELGAVYA